MPHPPEFAKPLSAATRLCAVYGAPIRHSASPAMHNAALATLGLDWRYVGCEVAPEHLGAAISGARHMGLIGLNLTVPHKLLALELMDELDVSARSWGAVNTVVFEAQDASGEWQPVGQQTEVHGPVRSKGYNTDADAIIRALREDLGTEPRSARVLLLGAGGAARATALRLADEGVEELWLVNRTEAKAVALAEEIRERFPVVTVEVGYPATSVEIVLNGTSLGLRRDDGSPLDESKFPLSRADSVYDMIYRPAETALLRAARAAGCRTANGLGMLLYQGAAALELWTGRPAPLEVMSAAAVA
ncbi:MAG TPA: shikimate dehydrogenase, partial [Candidatus Limnocylindria bacterium]|nr:shikimate dehydrogenase [Candidatus Limnocylindria bacterium]